MYTVRQVADLAGVTPRTLHHYDAVGLLKPTRLGDNGYRYYGEEALVLLQQILLYREQGLDLEKIRQTVTGREFSASRSLVTHRKALVDRIDRLRRMVDTVDRTLARLEQGEPMDPEELFRDLTAEEGAAYQDEAEARWDPRVVREAVRRFQSLPPGDRKQRKAADQSLYRDWSALAGTDPGAPRVLALVERWRKGVEFYWTPSLEGLVGLARMYNEDPRFRARYDRIDPRLAPFILDSVLGYVRVADPQRKSLGELLVDFEARNPSETEVVTRFREFLGSGEVLQGKSNLRRHITASAWIVSPDRTRVLLTHHAKLGKWVQLGGHTDPGEDWAAAAFRESWEESGLEHLRFLQPGLFDLDIHAIPARPDAPAHDHYDLRFLIEADPEAPLLVSEESRALAWVCSGDLEQYTREESQLRMARRILGSDGL